MNQWNLIKYGLSSSWRTIKFTISKERKKNTHGIGVNKLKLKISMKVWTTLHWIKAHKPPNIISSNKKRGVTISLRTGGQGHPNPIHPYHTLPYPTYPYTQTITTAASEMRVFALLNPIIIDGRTNGLMEGRKISWLMSFFRIVAASDREGS